MKSLISPPPLPRKIGIPLFIEKNIPQATFSSPLRVRFHGLPLKRQENYHWLSTACSSKNVPAERLRNLKIHARLIGAPLFIACLSHPVLPVNPFTSFSVVIPAGTNPSYRNSRIYHTEISEFRWKYSCRVVRMVSKMAYQPPPMWIVPAACIRPTAPGDKETSATGEELARVVASELHVSLLSSYLPACFHSESAPTIAD